MEDGSQAGVDPRTRDSEDGREWIPHEISGASPSVYARRRSTRDEPADPSGPEAPALFNRSRSRLANALGEVSGSEAESPLDRRLREAAERASALEERIRQTEERVAEAIHVMDRDAKQADGVSGEGENPK